MKNRLYVKSLVAALLLYAFSGCEEMMQVDSDYMLDAGDHYKTSGEVYGAFAGISAAFTGVADQLIMLSELKGDLLQPTQRAPEEYWNVFCYSADNSGELGSSKKFYDIVINVNDFLLRVQKYNADHPGDILESTYKGMISQAINYKVWSLMTIGQFWGEAWFYNDNLQEVNEEAMVRLTLDELPAFLMDYMQGGVAGVDAFQPLNWTEILGNSSANWTGSYMSGNILMGELNLWAGNYQRAIDYYLSGLTENATVPRVITASYGTVFGSSPASISQEVVTSASFNLNYHQTHSLSRIFLNRVYVQVSECAFDVFSTQLRSGYSEGDAVRSSASYRAFGTGSDGEPIRLVYKYTSPDTEIHIYRSGQIYLNIAEALTCLGRLDEAIKLIDRGLVDYYSGSAYVAPFTAYPTDLKASRGLRARANLLEWNTNELFEGSTSTQDSIRTMMNLLADETVLELAYEGKRWPALVRMARNLNDPSFLADKVVAKFGEAAQAGFRSLLMDPKNWYIQDDKNNTLK